MSASTNASDGDARALCWRSRRELDRLEARLREALDAWARDWGLGSPAVTLDNAWQASLSEEPAWQAMAADENGQSVAWLGHRDGRCLALERLLFDSAPDANASAPLARAAADDALAALRGHLVKCLGAVHDAKPSDSGPLPMDTRPWSGAVRAAIRLADASVEETFWLHLHADAWPQPAARPTGQGAQAGGLTELSLALADQPLKLQARLADVQVSLGELLGLREGDVLVTGHRLADPLSMTLPGGEAAAVFHGRLVQRQGRMAVTLMQVR